MKLSCLSKIGKIATLGICVLALSGCNGIDNTPDEEKILEDLQAKFPTQTIENAYMLEINRSQLKEDEKSWIADISIYSTDEYAEMQAESTITYDYYDDEGWMLNEEVANYPVFSVSSMNQGMTDEDITQVLGNNALDYVDDVFDSENGVHQINYKKTDNNYRLFSNVITGMLECVYVDSDSGWQVFNDIETSREIFIRTDNVMSGNFYSDFYDGNFTVKELSEDGQSITFSFTGPSGIGGRVREGKDYHAELEEINSNDEYTHFYAEYNIIDTETGESQRLQLSDFYNDNSGSEEASFSIWSSAGSAVYFYLV